MTLFVGLQALYTPADRRSAIHRSDRTARCSAGISEVGVVEQIERAQAELQIHAFSHFPGLLNGEVDVHVFRTVTVSTRLIADCRRCDVPPG